VNYVIHSIIFRNALTPIPYILLAIVDTGYLDDDYNMITAVSNCTG